MDIINIKIKEYSSKTDFTPVRYTVNSDNELIIEVNTYYAQNFTPPEMLFLLLHEIAHYILYIDKEDETLADEWALDQLFLLSDSTDTLYFAIDALRKMSVIPEERILNAQDYILELKGLDIYLTLLNDKKIAADQDLEDFYANIQENSFVSPEQMAVLAQYSEDLFNNNNSNNMKKQKTEKQNQKNINTGITIGKIFISWEAMLLALLLIVSMANLGKK